MRAMFMGDKIKAWLEPRKALGQVGLARKVNELIPPGHRKLTKQTLSSLINRNSQRSSFAPYIALAMGVDLDSLLAPNEPLRPLDPSEKISTAVELAESGARIVRFNHAIVPVISTREAALMCGSELVDFSEHDHIAVGFLENPPSARAFAIEIEGDSMEAPAGVSFPAGTIVVIDPARKPKAGDFILVCDGPESATLKRLVIDGTRRFLGTLNPRYPMMEWRDDFIILGTASGYHGRL